MTILPHYLTTLFDMQILTKWFIENRFSCNTTFICLLLFLISSFALFFICLLLRLFLVILFVFWSPFDCVSFDGLAPFQQYLLPHSCMCISLLLSPGERMRLKLVLKSEKKNPETNQNALLPSDSMTSLYYRTAMKYKAVLCPVWSERNGFLVYL